MSLDGTKYSFYQFIWVYRWVKVKFRIIKHPIYIDLSLCDAAACWPLFHRGCSKVVWWACPHDYFLLIPSQHLIKLLWREEIKQKQVQQTVMRVGMTLSKWHKIPFIWSAFFYDFSKLLVPEQILFYSTFNHIFTQSFFSFSNLIQKVKLSHIPHPLHAEWNSLCFDFDDRGLYSYCCNILRFEMLFFVVFF